MAMVWRKITVVVRRFRAVLGAVVFSFSLMAGAANVQAQAANRSSVERQVLRAFDQGEYERAITVLQRYLEESPNDPVMLYNLACAHARLGDADSAATALHRAFKNGFDNINHMRTDPDLVSLRAHPIYREILDAADRVANRKSQSALEQWRDAYGPENYRYETDERHRIHYATALDDVSHREMREMLERQADQMAKSLFGDMQDHYVLIAVPTPEDSDKFFNGDRSIGGMYQHGLRRLVARDIGNSLRHEYFHALHYGHMEKLNQPHALWVQEGLACLYEDYDLGEDGTITFLPNDRQLVVKGRARSGRLPKWNDMFALNAEQFMDKALQHYPVARSIFEYIAAQDKLKIWYDAYVTHFHEDRTGARAFEVAFEKPVEQVEREWRRWVIDQPTIELGIRPERAALGIRTSDNSSNDGVVVTDVIRGSAAAEAGVRKGDVIVALNDQPTRSIRDMHKIIAAHDSGDHVQVRARRNGAYFTFTVVLRPMPGV
jgi:tetratricopeptide (TPR) repeat protein